MKKAIPSLLLLIGLSVLLIVGCENFSDMTGGSKESDDPLVQTNTTADVTATNLPPPMVVWVDDDYNADTPGWGYDHFNTIAAGATAVSTNGGAILVYAGVYHEDWTGPFGTGLYQQGDLYVTPDALYVTTNGPPR